VTRRSDSKRRLVRARALGACLASVVIILAVAALGVVSAAGAPRASAAVTYVSNATTTSSDWTTYLAGNERSGFAPNEGGFNPTAAANLYLAWEASDSGSSGLDHGVFSQPIVSNGLVYWGSSDGYERANDTNGNPIWQTFLGHTVGAPGCTDPSSFGISSTGTVTSDVPVGTATSVLYVGGGDSKIYALNAATGAVLWSYDVGGNPNTFIWSSPAVFGNSVYIGVSSFGDCPLVQGRLLQLNRTTGALENTFDTVPNGCIGGSVWGSPTIDAAAGTIYFDTGNGGDCTSGEPLAPALIEVKAADLSLVGSWGVPPAQQNDDSDFGSTPTLFSAVIGGQPVNLVGAINKNGTYYALKRDALAAGPVWSVPIAFGGDNPTTGNGDVASSAFDGTTLYVGGDATNSCSGSLSALNPSTGAFIWQHCFSDGGYVLGGVTVTSGGVVAVGEGNNIAVFSAATGASVFTYTGSGTFWGPPSIVNGTLYEGDMAGHLYALTPSNQAPSVSVLRPTGGATLSRSTYLDAAASNATSVEFRLFGGSFGFNAPVVCTATSTIYGWLCAWNTTTVPNGSYVLVSVASGTGGTTASSGVSMTVNNPPPTTSVLIPSKGATVSGTGAVLDASASNATSVKFLLFGGSFGFNAPVICSATTTIYGWLCAWNTTTVPNGSYVLVSDATGAGGSTPSSGVNITVKN
jgi:outer membrane protein assembly factor BamB